jgi:hypothetical protein
MKVIFDEETFGITVKSLKKLRNELADRIHHKISIQKIQTDNLCCGFLIYDATTEEIIWTGDGFRPDGGGEGGVGYKSACALLQIYGFSHFNLIGIEVNFESHTREEVSSKLIECIKENNHLFIIADLSVLDTKKPIYLR